MWNNLLCLCPYISVLHIKKYIKVSLIIACVTNIYRSIKKVISLRNISKVFSHFYYTFMVYVLQYILLNVYVILFL